MNNKSKLKMENVAAHGKVEQSSDTVADVSMKDVRAKSAVQRVLTQLQTVEIFGWRGPGVWAIVAIVVVALAAILAQVIK